MTQEQSNLAIQVKVVYNQLAAAFCGTSQVPDRTFGMALGSHDNISNKFGGADAIDIINVAMAILEQQWPDMSDHEYDKAKAELTEGFEETKDRLENEVVKQKVKEVFDHLVEAVGDAEQVTDALFGATLAASVNAGKFPVVRQGVIINSAITLLDKYWESVTGYDETSSRKKLSDGFEANIKKVD